MVKEWIVLICSVVGGLIWMAALFSDPRIRNIEKAIKQENERKKQ